MFRLTRQPLWLASRAAVYATRQPIARQLAARTPSSFNKTALRFQSSSAVNKANSVSEEVKQRLSSEQPAPTIYDYNAIKQLVNNPDPSKVLVDVREPEEFAEYAIPTAINIPYKSTPGALDLSPEEFEDVFKFEKPGKDKELIFYCLAGVRSSAAADLAQIFGYEKLGNYKGSMEDWLAHEGKVE